MGSEMCIRDSSRSRRRRRRRRQRMTRVTRYLAGAAVVSLLTVGMAACGSGEPAAPEVPTDSPAAAIATAVPPDAAQPATSEPQAPTNTSATAATSAPAATSTSPAAPATEAPTAAATASVTQSPADPPAATSPPPAATEAPTAGVVPADTPAPATDTALPPIEAPVADVGTRVGETPPAFAMDLADGSRIESADIVGSGKPVFMMYFATW